MKPWGCSNKERKAGYWAQNGRSVDELGNFVSHAVWIEDRMIKECGYDNKSTDDRCKGCKDNVQADRREPQSGEASIPKGDCRAAG